MFLNIPLPSYSDFIDEETAKKETGEPEKANRSELIWRGGGGFKLICTGAHLRWVQNQILG